MNYVNILPDKDLLSDTAPPYVTALVESSDYESCILAGVSGGRLNGYAVFSHPIGPSKDIWLEYLYTPEKLRESGVASGILKYAESYMKKKGIINILCKTYLRFSEAKDTASFFVKRGYIPLSLDGRLLAYRYKDMKDSGFFDIISKKRDRLQPSLPAAKVGKQSLSAFLADSKKTGFSFEIKDIEKSFSRFTLDGNRIESALIAHKISEDMLLFKNPYISEKTGMINLFPVLFSDVIADAGYAFKDDFIILLNLNDDRSYYGMMQVFNPPEKEYLVQEFMNCLLAG